MPACELIGAKLTSWQLVATKNLLILRRSSTARYQRLREGGPQCRAALWIDHVHQGDAPAQILDEVRTPVAILTLQTVASGVVQNRPQLPNLVPRQGRPVV